MIWKNWFDSKLYVHVQARSNLEELDGQEEDQPAKKET